MFFLVKPYHSAYKQEKGRDWMFNLVLAVLLIAGMSLILFKKDNHYTGWGFYMGCVWSLLVVWTYASSPWVDQLFNVLNVLVFWVGLGAVLHALDTFYRKIIQFALSNLPKS